MITRNADRRCEYLRNYLRGVVKYTEGAELRAEYQQELDRYNRLAQRIDARRLREADRELKDS